MPEGDTVWKLAAALAPELCGKPLREIYLRWFDSSPLEGGLVRQVSSRGKHLLIQFDNGLVLRSHLGLYGSWHSYAPGERWRKPRRQASILLSTDSRLFVCFNAREVEILETGGFRLKDRLHRLGPDLSEAQLDLGEIEKRARAFLSPETLAVDLLLDQRVAAGIGNVFKSEILFLEGLFPLCLLSDLSPRQLRRVYGRAWGLLRRNLRNGPRKTRFREDGAGGLWVYGRAGRPCLHCGTSIRSELFGLRPRVTYWCPDCQRAGQVPSEPGDNSCAP